MMRMAILAAVRAVVAGDPAVAEGIFTAELQRWAPRFDATGVLAPPRP
ncbi:hypothetical protein [Phenylobacterium sp.]|nr:hypothetical protein [Phenylobacterium sp.]